MILSRTSIQRPVLTWVMNLVFLLFGLIGLSRLPVRELPNIDPPIVTVSTTFPGASAEVVETEITQRIEDELNSIEGIKRLTSESREQLSNVTVEFNLSRDIDAATQDVRDRVARIRGRLPKDVEEPVIAKQEADAQPMMWIALNSDRLAPLELSELAETELKDVLQTVPGVSSVLIGGQKRFAIRLWLDSAKMAARKVTVTDVERALRTQNVELPSGRVESVDREMTIQTQGELKTAEQFNRLVVKSEGTTLVRLGDIGEARVGAEDERSRARYNGKPAVGLGIVKQSQANTVEVAHGIAKELERLKPLLPAGVATSIAYNEAVYVEKAIEEVWITLGIAFVLVVVVIYTFLGDARSTLIPTLAVPVSIVGTFLVLLAFGYSVNILTMLALVLAIGVVVDDAIVVLENIHRHIEEGLAPRQAAFKAMEEIAFAIIAITLSLVAIFIPLAFQTSATGRLFIEYAIAVAGAVIISAFVALTLTPMVASRMLTQIEHRAPGLFFRGFERLYKAGARAYERALRWALRHRPTVTALALGTLVCTGLLLRALPQEFLPEEDKGRLLCFLLAPEGATSEYTDRMVHKAEAIIRSVPEVKGYFAAVALARGGPGVASQGLMFVTFHDDRARRVQDIVGGPHGLGARFFNEVEGALAIPIVPKAIGRGFGQPLQLVIQAQDLAALDRFTQAFANKLRAEPTLLNVRPSFQINKPQLDVQIDRDRAASLGVSIEEISRTLQVLFGGLELSNIKLGGKEYDVIAQLERASRLTPADLERVYVRNTAGRLIQLSGLVTATPTIAPASIFHHDRLRSSTIEATPVGVPLGTAMDRVEALLKQELPPGFRYTWTGESDDLRETSGQLFWVVLLALVVVYLVLAAQFESWVHPLTVMLALPLAAFGALGLLWLLAQVNTLGTMLYGWAHYAPAPPPIAKILSTLVPRIPAMNLNLFSQIGMLLLFGLVTKNSIMLVEFANQQRAAGLNARDAMVQAGIIRLRPILMTAFSTVMGILPIAIGFGAGAESRRPMGVAVVGGVLMSTFLTLLVIPVVYTLFDDLARKLGRRTKK